MCIEQFIFQLKQSRQPGLTSGLIKLVLIITKQIEMMMQIVGINGLQITQVVVYLFI